MQLRGVFGRMAIRCKVDIYYFSRYYNEILYEYINNLCNNSNTFEEHNQKWVIHKLLWPQFNYIINRVTIIVTLFIFDKIFTFLV